MGIFQYIKKNRKMVFGIVVFILFLYFLSSIDKENIEKISSSFGYLGIIIIGFFLIVTQVFAPLSGSAFFFSSIKLYGFEITMILFYCTSMISASIAFFIARRWGRNLVIKFVGKKHIGKIDDIVVLHENKLLIIGRTLGYYFFDFVSYGLGLTYISFKKYMLYTAILSLIPMSLLYFFFRDFNFDFFSNILFFYGTVILMGVIFTYYFTRIIKNHKD